MGDKVEGVGREQKHCGVVSWRCEKPLQQEVIRHIFVLEWSLTQPSTEKGLEQEKHEGVWVSGRGWSTQSAHQVSTHASCPPTCFISSWSLLHKQNQGNPEWGSLPHGTTLCCLTKAPCLQYLPTLPSPSEPTFRENQSPVFLISQWASHKGPQQLSIYWPMWHWAPLGIPWPQTFLPS